MDNGLCIFCDELDTPDHHNLKHKGVRLVIVEPEDDLASDDLASDDIEEVHQIQKAVKDPDTFVETIKNSDPLIEPLECTSPLLVLVFVSDVLMVHKVDSHVKEVEESPQQSTSVDDKYVAYQVFDQMPLRVTKQEKHLKHLKGWKFKFKRKNLIGVMPQIEQYNIRKRRSKTLKSFSSNNHVESMKTRITWQHWRIGKRQRSSLFQLRLDTRSYINVVIPILLRNETEEKLYMGLNWSQRVWKPGILLWVNAWGKESYGDDKSEEVVAEQTVLKSVEKLPIISVNASNGSTTFNAKVLGCEVMLDVLPQRSTSKLTVFDTLFKEKTWLNLKIEMMLINGSLPRPPEGPELNEDFETTSAIGFKSHNALMTELVVLKTHTVKAQSSQSSGDFRVDFVALVSAAIDVILRGKTELLAARKKTQRRILFPFCYSCKNQNFFAKHVRIGIVLIGMIEEIQNINQFQGMEGPKRVLQNLEKNKELRNVEVDAMKGNNNFLRDDKIILALAMEEKYFEYSRAYTQNSAPFIMKLMLAKKMEQADETITKINSGPAHEWQDNSFRLGTRPCTSSAIWEFNFSRSS